MYLPGEMLNQNYRYYLNNNNILIVTNNNCYTQYSSTYCDCYYFIPGYKVLTESRACSVTNNNYEINYDQFTAKDIYNIWNVIPFIIGILFVMMLLLGVKR